MEQTTSHRMTENLIVETEDCQIRDIANILKNDATVFKKWKELAEKLGMNEAKREKLEQDSLLNKLTLSDIIYQVLGDWKLRTGSAATLLKLIECIDLVKWFHVSELLSNHYGISYVRNQLPTITKKFGFEVENPVDLFTGRGVELEMLHKQLSRSSSTNSDTEDTTINQRVAIIGLGGIGKTQLVRQYIYVHGDNFNNILWINGESELSIQQSFKSIAMDELQISLTNRDGVEKKIFTIVSQVYRKLEGSRTLVVFDNATFITNFKKYMPTNQRGHAGASILVTSRDREWDFVSEMNIIVIDELEMDEAIKLMKKGLFISNDEQTDDIKCLLKLLQCFPLAIQQAISYINHKVADHPNYRINKYIDEFHISKEKLLDSRYFQDSSNYTHTTLTTWKSTLEIIESDNDYGNLAIRIFYIIAYMESDVISHDFFNHMREIVKVQTNLNLTLKRMFHSFIYMGANTEPMVEHEVTKEKVNHAIKLLVKYSMIKRVSDDSVSVHKLVQKVTLMKLREEEKENHVLQEALELLSKADNHSLLTHGPTIWKAAEKSHEVLEAYSRIPLKISEALNADMASG